MRKSRMTTTGGLRRRRTPCRDNEARHEGFTTQANHHLTTRGALRFVAVEDLGP